MKEEMFLQSKTIDVINDFLYKTFLITPINEETKIDFLQKSKNDQRFVCFLSTLKSHVLLS